MNLVNESNVKILDKLLKEGKKTKTELSRELQTGYSFIHYKMKDFVGEGLVEEKLFEDKKNKFYVLTNKGKSAAKKITELDEL